LTYDGAGNLIDDGEYSYTWQMGRQLQGITGTGLTTSYKYNEDGLRTEKTVNGQTHVYTLLGSSVTREVIKDATGNMLWTIHYSYAGDSTPVSMNVNGTEYYYLKNAQGDITHIVDEEGNEVASYEYDAWGNILSITGGDIAQLNPYRYRGYRYDSETGLYYLQSRYYNPEWGRFISRDATDVLTVSIDSSNEDKNLYIYCDNNPIVRADSGGQFWHIIGGAIVGGLISGGVKAVTNVVEGKNWSDGIGMAICTGAASGALAATGFGLAVQVGGGALISMAGNATSQIMQNNGFENFDVGDMLIDGAIGGLAGLVGGKGAGSKHLNSLGKQAARRTAKELARNGVSAAGRELPKATSYYVKNAKHVVKPLLKSLRDSGVVSFFGSLVKSIYALSR
jgi:RHS repeat-associated protein